jgi:hypothetical protein
VLLLNECLLLSYTSLSTQSGNFWIYSHVIIVPFFSKDNEDVFNENAFDLSKRIDFIHIYMATFRCWAGLGFRSQRTHSVKKWVELLRPRMLLVSMRISLWLPSQFPLKKPSWLLFFFQQVSGHYTNNSHLQLSLLRRGTVALLWRLDPGGTEGTVRMYTSFRLSLAS